MIGDFWTFFNHVIFFPLAVFFVAGLTFFLEHWLGVIVVGLLIWGVYRWRVK